MNSTASITGIGVCTVNRPQAARQAPVRRPLQISSQRKPSKFSIGRSVNRITVEPMAPASSISPAWKAENPNPICSSSAIRNTCDVVPM